MSIVTRAYPRATAPHLQTLETALAPLLAVANAGAFALRYDGTNVVVEQALFTGVDHVAVQNAINAAIADDDHAQAKFDTDNIPLMVKAALLVLLDGLNLERTTSGRATISPSQFLTQVKAKVDTL